MISYAPDEKGSDPLTSKKFHVEILKKTKRKIYILLMYIHMYYIIIIIAELVKKKMKSNISNKQRLNIVIDMDVYLSVKMSGVNISSLVNDFLKSYFEENNPAKNIDVIEKDIKEKEDEMTVLKSALARVRQEEKLKEEEMVEKAKAMQTAMKDSRVLDF